MAASQEYFVAVDGDRKQITKLGAVKVRVGGTQTLFSPWKGDSLAEFAQRIQTAVDAGTKVSCARASRRLLSRLLTSSHVCSRVSCAGGTEDATGARCPGQLSHTTGLAGEPASAAPTGRGREALAAVSGTDAATAAAEATEQPSEQ